MPLRCLGEDNLTCARDHRRWEREAAARYRHLLLGSGVTINDPEYAGASVAPHRSAVPVLIHGSLGKADNDESGGPARGVRGEAELANAGSSPSPRSAQAGDPRDPPWTEYRTPPAGFPLLAGGPRHLSSNRDDSLGTLDDFEVKRMWWLLIDVRGRPERIGCGSQGFVLRSGPRRRTLGAAP